MAESEVIKAVKRARNQASYIDPAWRSDSEAYKNAIRENKLLTEAIDRLQELEIITAQAEMEYDFTLQHPGAVRRPDKRLFRGPGGEVDEEI